MQPLKLGPTLARIFCVGIALFAATGCASAYVTPQAAPAARSVRPVSGTRGGWLSPRAKSGKGLVYVSDNDGNAVYIFDKNDLAQGP
ncbi:MAG: hypothetical protein WAM84_01815, partial [Candidatus Cybelea sp.]